MSKKDDYAVFYNVIDSEFAEYEKSGCDKDVYDTMKNNIASSMLKTFKKVYGEESEFYLHSSMVYMKTINACVSSYLNKTSQKRTGKFHSFFLKTLIKNINESCRLERESSGLGVSFGKETESASAARRKLFKIRKDYNDLIKYDDSLSEFEIVKKIAIIENITIKEVEVFMPFIDTSTVSTTNENSDGNMYSLIDTNIQRKISNGNRPKLEIPEELVISRDNMKIILDSIEDIYNEEQVATEAPKLTQEQKEKKLEDLKFLSLVLTFKILTLFEPNATSKRNNSYGEFDYISFLPESYNLKEMLFAYDFIDKKIVDDFFKGSFPEQKDLERSQGSVIQKWKQFNKKLLKKYGPRLEEIQYD